MKKTLFSLFIVALIAACGGPGSGENPTANRIDQTTSSNNSVIAHVNVEGMTCAMGCAKAIENNLNDLSGVKVATVNFEEKKAVIEFDQGDLSKDELINVISSTNGGGIYEVTSFELEELVQDARLERESDEKEGSFDKSNPKVIGDVEVSMKDMSKEIVAENFEIIFPSIFRALLDMY